MVHVFTPPGKLGHLSDVRLMQRAPTASEFGRVLVMS